MASGPVAQQLFRNFGKMTNDDQETMAKFAEMLLKSRRKMARNEFRLDSSAEAARGRV